MTDPKASLKPTQLLVRKALGSIVDKYRETYKDSSVLVDKYARLSVQHKYLKGIHDGLYNCHKFPVDNRFSFSPHYVRYEIYESGKRHLGGLNCCSSPDCSVCGGRKRMEVSRTLELAMKEHFMTGGEALFLSLTQKAGRSPKQITNVLEAQKYMRIQIREYNRSGHGIMYFQTCETTFSHNRGDLNIQKFHYHSHSHQIILIPAHSAHLKERIKKKVRKWWITGIEKAGGTIRYQPPAKRAGQLINKGCIRIDEADPSKLLANYITKCTLPMEVTRSDTKVSLKNRSLEQLKADMYTAPNGNPLKGEITMLQDYIKTMYKKHRFNYSDGVKELAQAWKQRINHRDQNHIHETSIYEYCEARGIDVNSLPAHTLKFLLDLRPTPTFAEVTSPKPHWMDDWLDDPILNPHSYYNITMARMELRDCLVSISKFRSFIYQKNYRHIYSSPIAPYIQKRSNQQSDNLLHTYKIPHPLWKVLHKEKLIWPILEALRDNALQLNFWPRLSFMMEKLSSPHQHVLSDGSRILLGGVNNDPTKQRFKDTVLNLISEAIIQDTTPTSSFNDWKVPFLQPPKTPAVNSKLEDLLD